MLPSINPTLTPAWSALQQHAETMKQMHLRELFGKDPGRFQKYSLSLDGLLFDYSKNIISDKTLELLLSLATDCKIKEAIASMFNGDLINATEKRAVLHTALR